MVVLFYNFKGEKSEPLTRLKKENKTLCERGTVECAVFVFVQVTLALTGLIWLLCEQQMCLHAYLLSDLP